MQIAGFRGVVADPSKPSATRDPGRAVYRYHLTFPGPGNRSFTRKMFACAIRLGPWTERTMRAHEATTADARDKELAKIRANRTHAAPVIAGFRDVVGEVDRLLRKAETARPTVERTTPDGVTHRLWRIQDAELVGKLRHYFAPFDLYVLDGHERYEAMYAFHQELASKQSLALYSSANYGMALLIELGDPGLVVAPRHRVVRGAPVKGPAVLEAVQTHFLVERLDGAAKDVAKLVGALGLADNLAHQPAFVAVFAGDADAYKLTLKPDVSLLAEGVAQHRQLQKSEPVVLDGLILQRPLRGAQVTTELEAGKAIAAVGSGADAAFLMHSVSIDEILRIADADILLPAHSTALFPPIAPDLLSFVVDPDEDLV